MPNILHCPFCGAQSDSSGGPEIREYDRVDRLTLRKDGRPKKRIYITHRVECTDCGASGPSSATWMDLRDEIELTDEMIERSASAAAFAWNTRQPINDRAYDLVSRLIVEAHKRLET